MTINNLKTDTFFRYRTPNLEKVEFYFLIALQKTEILIQQKLDCKPQPYIVCATNELFN